MWSEDRDQPVVTLEFAEKGITVMAMGDKIKNAAEQAAGKTKEAAGKVTGNQDLEARGQADQTSADAKQAGEKVKDAAKDVFDR